MSKIQIFCQVKEWLEGFPCYPFMFFGFWVFCVVNGVSEDTSPPDDFACVQGGGDSPFCLILWRLQGQRKRIWDKYNMKSTKKSKVDIEESRRVDFNLSEAECECETEVAAHMPTQQADIHKREMWKTGRFGFQKCRRCWTPWISKIFDVGTEP